MHKKLQLTLNNKKLCYVDPISVTVTELNHIFCEGMVLINTVLYNFHIHLYFSNGRWLKESERDENYRRIDDVYLSRVNDINNPSHSAYKKSSDFISEDINEALTDLEIFDNVRRSAGIDNFKRELESKNNELHEILQRTKELKRNIRDLESKIDSLQ